MDIQPMQTLFPSAIQHILTKMREAKGAGDPMAQMEAEEGVRSASAQEQPFGASVQYDIPKFSKKGSPAQNDLYKLFESQLMEAHAKSHSMNQAQKFALSPPSRLR
jgi:hypothetical protein